LYYYHFVCLFVFFQIAIIINLPPFSIQMNRILQWDPITADPATLDVQNEQQMERERDDR